jgi:integrase
MIESYEADLLLTKPFSGINPKIVSERLGHSTIMLNMDVYSHVLPNMQQDATNRLEEMIFKSTAA